MALFDTAHILLMLHLLLGGQPKLVVRCACLARHGRVIALFGTDFNFGNRLGWGNANNNFAPGTVEFFVPRLVPDRVLIS